MSFNSLTFIIFGALFFALWPILRGRKNLRWGYLVVASFIFYGWWDWRFIFLLIASGLIDFIAALAMVRFPNARKLLLMVSIAGTLISLAAFKYITFLSENANRILHAFGSDLAIPVISAALPVGISFYTFQSMSYTIDVYRGRLTPTRNILHFFAYLAMFPQLVAGPIIRASDLLPQLENVSNPSEERQWQGMKLIALGYFKKVVIADNLAPAVDYAFGMGLVIPSAPYWWLVVSLFAFQIYFDFSGYSDIARGLAKWMGYEFRLNFHRPYLASSFREFWQRWHISLSSWFRDYLYIPLGGNKHGSFMAHVNMWITMLLSGLWHGAAWTFVAWGALHAAYLSFERLTRWPERLKKIKGGAIVASALLILQVWVAWVFFRAKSFEQAAAILSNMFNPSLSALPLMNPIFEPALFFLIVAVLTDMFGHLRERGIPRLAPRANSILEPMGVALLLTACVFLRGPGQAFIYFQF
jgi:alginate O-acetyltransferase complex protein AlgI